MIASCPNCGTKICWPRGMIRPPCAKCGWTAYWDQGKGQSKPYIPALLVNDEPDPAPIAEPEIKPESEIENSEQEKAIDETGEGIPEVDERRRRKYFKNRDSVEGVK